jgi:Na+-driven multidrug efflux pump
MYRLIFMSAPYFLCGIMDSTSYLLKGMGKQIVPTLIVLIGTVLCRVVWIFTVCRMFPGSPETLSNISYLYISYPVTWIIAISANLIYYAYLKKRLFAGTLDVRV